MDCAIFRACFLSATLLVAGCKVSSPITPAGKDTYMVSSHVAACISCSATVKSMQTANEFCAKQKKFAVIRNSTGSTNPLGYNVSSELIFSCVDENDPDYQRPTLRKDDGVLTVTH